MNELPERFFIYCQLHDTLFGNLFLALDQDTKKVVMVKYSSKSLISKGKEEGVMEDIIREASFFSELNSSTRSYALEQNIPSDLVSRIHSGSQHYKTVHELIETKESYFSISESISGYDLFALLYASKRKASSHLQPHKDVSWLTETEARPLLFQIACALANLHTKGVAHRDVSPENIVVSRGQAFLIDFGCAIYVRPSQVSHDLKTLLCKISVTEFGRPGKKQYMSPEAYDGVEYDPFMADTYALGVVMFIALTGSLAYNHPRDKFAQVLHQGTFSTHSSCSCSCHIMTSITDKESYQEEMKQKRDERIYSNEPRNCRELSYHGHRCSSNPECVLFERCKHLTSDALDLLQHLLCPETKRYNIFQILSHRWFSSAINNENAWRKSIVNMPVTRSYVPNIFVSTR